jgi:uncharacterized membrane protein
MTRHSRKSKRKINKRPKSTSVVSPSNKSVERTPLPSGVAKLDPDKSVINSKSIFIEASAETCFEILVRQLEQPPQWDPMIVHAWPASDIRGRIGATSQLTLNLGGKKVEAQAMISRYHPNRAISWVSAGKPKVREDWRLEQKPNGTLVGVTLAREVGGWVIGRMLHKITRQKKIEHDLDRMLAQLKALVGGVDRNQMVGG